MFKTFLILFTLLLNINLFAQSENSEQQKTQNNKSFSHTISGGLLLGDPAFFWASYQYSYFKIKTLTSPGLGAGFEVAILTFDPDKKEDTFYLKLGYGTFGFYEKKETISSYGGSGWEPTSSENEKGKISGIIITGGYRFFFVENISLLIGLGVGMGTNSSGENETGPAFDFDFGFSF